MAKKKKKKQKKSTDVIVESLMSLLEVDLSDCLSNLCLAFVDDDSPVYKRVSVTDEVAAEFRDVASKVFEKLAKNASNGNFSVRAYDAIAKLDKHEVEHLNLGKHPFVKKQIDGLAKISKLAKFTKKDLDDSALRFYAIVFEPKGSEPIYFFRSCSPKMEIHQSSKFAFVFKEDEFDKFDEKVFVFDRGVDCFVRGNELFILSKGKFESLFNFFAEVKEAASETLEKIRATIPIDNFEELETACLGHIQMLKKLKNIASQPYLDRIKMSDIKAVIKEMGLSLKVKKIEGKEKLTFDVKDKWEILRLLDDDYLKSLMTGEKYEVNSKRSR